MGTFAVRLPALVDSENCEMRGHGSPFPSSTVSIYVMGSRPPTVARARNSDVRHPIGFIVQCCRGVAAVKLSMQGGGVLFHS